MKCPVCKDYDFEHLLDLEKHSVSVHGASAEKLVKKNTNSNQAEPREENSAPLKKVSSRR